jgi:hypothetical protein
VVWLAQFTQLVATRLPGWSSACATPSTATAPPPPRALQVSQGLPHHANSECAASVAMPIPNLPTLYESFTCARAPRVGWGERAWAGEAGDENLLHINSADGCRAARRRKAACESGPNQDERSTVNQTLRLLQPTFPSYPPAAPSGLPLRRRSHSRRRPLTPPHTPPPSLSRRQNRRLHHVREQSDHRKLINTHPWHDLTHICRGVGLRRKLVRYPTLVAMSTETQYFINGAARSQPLLP